MPSLVQLDPTNRIPAGDFSHWLRITQASQRSRKTGVDVPCGSCRGCCRSSMFIHIQPHEKQTIQSIPRALLFPAPGLPKGHLLMGYDATGQCPMLRDGDCSIYEHRPQTCRDYDCRVFAATGFHVDEPSQPEIARRVRDWFFEYDTDESRAQHTSLQKAAAFLQSNRHLFPQGSIPTQPGSLAALAIRIHELFTGTPKPESALVDQIMGTLKTFGHKPRK